MYSAISPDSTFPGAGICDLGEYLHVKIGLELVLSH